MISFIPNDFLNDVTVFSNLSESELVEHTLRNDKSVQLSSNGSLTLRTGKYTGRAADDKYVVYEKYSEEVIDWSSSIRKMTPDVFDSIKQDILKKYNENKKPLYTTIQSVSADPEFALEVRLLTPSASHALFSKTIFREKNAICPLGHFTIYHYPEQFLDKHKYNLNSETVIAINFSTTEIIISGTGYAGEIKKSIFSVLNTILPDLGVLPMHTGSNQDKALKTSLFFGLSGTGKTTLSTDSNVDLIGDDEHGLSEKGIFNFEGGCYAKTNGLSFEREPEIFNSSNSFKSILENVLLDPITREPQYDDKSITENGRSTYSLKSLPNIVESSCGAIPSNIFFLSADAMGVLPAISRLDSDQAMYYFLTGYTAKLAGTELGIKGVKAAFSHCFGAPFMMRKPNDYGELLKKFLNKYPINVWLVNTGWYGGEYGVGERYPLKFTRSCIRAIQKGNFENTFFEKTEYFDLDIPTALEGVNPEYLNPKNLWKDQNAYLDSAKALKEKFDDNFKKFLL
jgi:phosphoenolpyruvate carboxykinase (ATP)